MTVSWNYNFSVVPHNGNARLRQISTTSICLFIVCLINDKEAQMNT